MKYKRELSRNILYFSYRFFYTHAHTLVFGYYVKDDKPTRGFVTYEKNIRYVKDALLLAVDKLEIPKFEKLLVVIDKSYTYKFIKKEKNINALTQELPNMKIVVDNSQMERFIKALSNLTRKRSDMYYLDNFNKAFSFEEILSENLPEEELKND